MMEKYAVVLGLYPAPAKMEYGVDVLRGAGFPNTNISVLFTEKPRSKKRTTTRRTTRLLRRRCAGAASGAIIGGALGWLIGTGVLVGPGMAPLVAAGPITAALAGLGAFGGVAAALIAWGVPESRAAEYEKQIERGGALVSVHCDNPTLTDRAAGVLKRTAAHDIFLTVQHERALSAG